MFFLHLARTTQLHIFFRIKKSYFRLYLLLQSISAFSFEQPHSGLRIRFIFYLGFSDGTLLAITKMGSLVRLLRIVGWPVNELLLYLKYNLRNTGLPVILQGLVVFGIKVIYLLIYLFIVDREYEYRFYREEIYYDILCLIVPTTCSNPLRLQEISL